MTTIDGVRHDPLVLREIRDNLTVRADSVRGWYVVPSSSWSFMADAERAHRVAQTALRYAGLVGVNDIHLRVTSRPYPVTLWARHLHDMTQRTARGPLPGCEGNTWADHLKRAQAHVSGYSLADKEVYLGVPLQRRGTLDRLSDKFTGQSMTARERDSKALNRRLNEVTKALSGPGMNARPATPREVEWLVHRSVGLLMPAPLYLSPVDDPRWDADDLAAFTEGIDYELQPGSKTVKIIDTRNLAHGGGHVERWAAVLTVGRMGPVDTESSHPWLQRLDSLGFPVEVSARLSVVAGSTARQSVAKLRQTFRSQQKHHDDFELDPPLELERLTQRALLVEDEMAAGEQLVSTRVIGHWRIAVTGRDEDECLDRVRLVREHYQQAQIEIAHPRGQYGLLREFTPEEPLAQTAYRRRMPVQMAAAAQPQVTATVGDRRGDYIGYTVGSAVRPVMYDPHYGPEVMNVSGCIPVIGELGAGKSTVVGQAAYLAARRGITTTILDPAGPLAGLCYLPEMAGYARHVDLLHGKPGSLNPASVVLDPLRESYETAAEWDAAMTVAGQNRRALMLDIARQLLPPQVAGDKVTRSLLGSALRALPRTRNISLWDVVDQLAAHKKDRDSTNIADLLRDMAEMPQASLFFPADDDPDDNLDATLLVLTMQGLVLPDASVPRDEWSVDEQLSVPLLHLATYYATRRVYGLPRTQRKVIGLDEAGHMNRWASGRSLYTGLARGSRKENVAVYVSSQNPGDVLGLNVANYVSTAFVGRIMDETIASEALRLLRIPAGIGYEQVLHGLSPVNQGSDDRRRHREFVMLDPFGNREVIRIDLSHMPDVLAAIDSTPGLRDPA